MKNLHNLMEAFHSAILDNDADSFAPSVHPNPRLEPQRQLAIYIEGYRTRLVEAIRSDYPATLDLLEESAFDALALRYIESHPPEHWSLDHYPHPFASYLYSHSDNAFAADIATLEGAIAEIFLQEDSPPLEPSILTSLAPEDFGAMVLLSRTASCMLMLDYPVDTYLTQQRAGQRPSPPEAEISFLYLVRHKNEVCRHPLSQAEYLVLEQLRQQHPVGVALETVAQLHPEFLSEIADTLQTWFERWITHGFFQSPGTYIL